MQAIDTAISILKQGGLVGLPTETVYGLAGDAANEEALREIFRVKNRPASHPLIVHIGEISQLSMWATDISEQALVLAKNFWPGPLTLILKKAPQVSSVLTAGQDSIAIRIPNHPIALQLLQKFGGGVAAPSANKFGRISPTTALAVKSELGEEIKCVLDGGPCDVGVESTIVDMRSASPILLRPGMISISQVEEVLQCKVNHNETNTIRVSGSCESHYAPVTATEVLSAGELADKISNATNSLGVISYSLPKSSASNIAWRSIASNPKEFAHSLYALMRELDQLNLQCILIEAVPDLPEWLALADRLKRAKHN